MPDTKLPTEPAAPGQPAPSPALEGKAPPQAERRLSSIPPALAVSGMASRIPPAPRPPTRAQQHSDGLPEHVRPKHSRPQKSRPQSSQPHAARPPISRPKSSHPESLRSESLRRLVATTPAAALDEKPDERPTTHPVVTTQRPAPRRDGGAVLLGMAAAGLLLGTLWLLREPARPAQAPALAPAAAAASDGARVARATHVARTSEPAAAAPNLELDESKPVTLPQTGSTHGPSASSAPRRPAPEAQAAPTVPVASATPAVTETETAAPAASASEEAPAPAPALPAFDAEAAKHALGASARAASSCRKGDDPTGTAEVIVTFAPSGRVTSANVNGAPYAGTRTGGCIAATLRGATVPPFAGNHLTVRKLVVVR
ncbi:MAG TPA: hypothetical protein VI197_30885 [Polyangiaceae bacterium]